MRTFTLLLAPLLGALAGFPTVAGPGRADPPAPPLRYVAARELTEDQQIRHVLSRLTFGARPGDVERVRALGVDRWIERQLHPESIDDAAGRAIDARYPSLSLSTADLIRSYRTVVRARSEALREAGARGDTTQRAILARLLRDPGTADATRAVARVLGDLQSAKLARAVASERQLYEVMVDFWANHFSVFAEKGLVRFALPHYDREVIRPHALGRFRDLLGAVAKSPAMLYYLDNWQSVADSSRPTLVRRPRMARRPRAARGLNENYARELLELHTLGVDGGYTQQDVIEVARTFTGWTINPRSDSGFLFRPAMHDAGAKVVLGHTLPAGRGMQDGEAVLDIIARHPSTARHIAHELATRFVSDEPPPELVERAAATFLRTDGDIRETLRTIVTSPEFFSQSAYRAKVKTPFELVASTLRALNATPDTTPLAAQFVAHLGQPIWGRATPDGWPDTAGEWMNMGAILDRIRFGLAMAGGHIPGVNIENWSARSQLRAAERPAQVHGVIAAFIGEDVSSTTRDVLMSGENPLLRSDEAMGPTDDTRAARRIRALQRLQSSGAAPARVYGALAARLLDQPVQLSGLEQIVGLALGSPEFQRR